MYSARVNTELDIKYSPTVQQEMSKKSECVKVVVRCRPLVEDEVAHNYKRVVSMDSSRGEVVLENPHKAGQGEEGLRRFTFDSVYDWNSKQIDLYDETFNPIVEAVLQGYNGTIFAYGQTGSGKTYTMAGDRDDPEKRGVIPNSFDHIFSHIARSHDEQYLVRASYLEIYQEEVRDLLSKDHNKKLQLREKPDTGVYVQDLSSFIAKSVREIEHVMSVGGENRKVGCTNMNKHSSRSHAIFVVTVECSTRDADGDDHIHVGKLNLVDLAGSERQGKTGSSGERFKEATKINLSLSALGNVISALVDGRHSHIPYRDSQLTRLLQDSLGGNAKTVMVANIGPAGYNFEETLITLRYAHRAKSIKNRPHINEDPKDALLREYQEEILRLKGMLEKRKKKGDHHHHPHRLTPEGEVISEESEGEGEEGRGGRGGRSLAAQQSQLEAEKQAILHNKELLVEEREKLVSAVQGKADQLKKEQKKRDSLAAKIKAMESKLLAGGKTIVDHTTEQQRKLEQQRQEVAQQKRVEREMRQQLEAKEETNMEFRETFSSLKEEVEIKTRKLNKLISKLRATRAEISDCHEENAIAREQLVIAAENLQKELSLKMLIIKHFIPPEEVEALHSRAVLSTDTEEWSLQPRTNTDKSPAALLPRPTSVAGRLRPISAAAQMVVHTGDPRYLSENVLKVDLEMPNRTTRDYEGPSMAPSLQAALNRAMTDDEEITVDAIPFTSSHKMRSKTKSRTRLRHASDPVSSHSKPPVSSTSDDNRTNFPSSRGLVTPTVRFA